MADEATLKQINKEFALYIRNIPSQNTSVEEIDTLKEDLREILGQYQDLVSPG